MQSIHDIISRELSIAGRQVKQTLELVAGGATVPFIARYRKEVTGNLDETQIRDIRERHEYYCELDDRKKTVLATIEEQGKLTAELRQLIESTLSKTELEDLYLPYKPKRKTRASVAREKGLEPLADTIMRNERASQPVEQIVRPFINEQVPDTDAAITGARDIIAERISEHPAIRNQLRDRFAREGRISTKVKKDKATEKSKYEMYYDFSEPIQKIPSHRVLAIFRGEHEKFLQVTFDVPVESCHRDIERHIIRSHGGEYRKILNDAIVDSFTRLLLPSLSTDIRNDMKDAADRFAIETFAKNLRQLLLAPPLGAHPVLALDPGFRTGIKTAALDKTGKLLEHTVLYPHEPHRKVEQAYEIVRKLIRKYSIRHIAVGNGTASRETESFLHEYKKLYSDDCEIIVVNESGASIYSVSDYARAEFPDLDATVRGAISIGRRLQDPLAELVKIEPKSLGVGQYQHDVNQKLLQAKLDQEVEHCVNMVGVDLNTASTALLSYTAGIGQKLAHNIVAYRDENGPFMTKKELRKVPKLGPKAFEQSSGFLRIRNGKNPLDASGIHPESYYIVEKMIRDFGVSVDQLIGNDALIKSIDMQRYVDESIGIETIRDITAELSKPGHDPREPYEPLKFNEDVQKLEDVKEGMILPGVITNVTNFGAFVDVGVHQDGLIHISQLSDTYISDPCDVVKIGQRVHAKVMSVDVERRRLSLSLKNM